MNSAELVKLGREALVMVLLLGGPVLVTSLVWAPSWRCCRP